MKQFIELIKELRKTPRGKGILFFAFYFIVFLILFIVLSFSKKTGYVEKDYEVGEEAFFNTAPIVGGNYHFIYTITKDNIKYVYEGDRDGNNELFTLNNKTYYYDGNKYYLDNKEVANPYIYSDFINFNNTSLLIENAMLDYKTDYRSGNTKYSFLISSNTINSLINNKETDIEEVPNNIIINSDEDSIVNEITYHLDSYCEYDSNCKDKLEIDLSYDKFGEIEEIVNK